MSAEPTLPLLTDHARHWRENRYVYPVLSRRSRGLSVGINLNPDKVCNFDCIYCQVNRRSEAETTFVAIDRLLHELDAMLSFVRSGEIFRDEKFSAVPQPWRRFNDIAFSGDGEPTTHRNFAEVVGQVAALKQRHGLDAVRLVLITNASMLHRPPVQRGLQLLDENNGEIWAKLEAGTDEYYRRIERTRIPFRQVLENITSAAKVRPVVIQSLFMRVEGKPPATEEVAAYIQRLQEITAAGGQLRRVQIYTVARQPAESYVTPLSAGEVDGIAETVAVQTGLPVERFYGPA